jgi:hypothetical protein
MNVAVADAEDPFAHPIDANLAFLLCSRVSMGPPAGGRRGNGTPTNSRSIDYSDVYREAGHWTSTSTDANAYRRTSLLFMSVRNGDEPPRRRSQKNGTQRPPVPQMAPGIADNLANLSATRRGSSSSAGARGALPAHGLTRAEVRIDGIPMVLIYRAGCRRPGPRLAPLLGADTSNQPPREPLPKAHEWPSSRIERAGSRLAHRPRLHPRGDGIHGRVLKRVVSEAAELVLANTMPFATFPAARATSTMPPGSPIWPMGSSGKALGLTIPSRCARELAERRDAHQCGIEEPVDHRARSSAC